MSFVKISIYRVDCQVSYNCEGEPKLGYPCTFYCNIQSQNNTYKSITWTTNFHITNTNFHNSKQLNAISHIEEHLSSDHEISKDNNSANSVIKESNTQQTHEKEQILVQYDIAHDSVLVNQRFQGRIWHQDGEGPGNVDVCMCNEFDSVKCSIVDKTEQQNDVQRNIEVPVVESRLIHLNGNPVECDHVDDTLINITCSIVTSNYVTIRLVAADEDNGRRVFVPDDVKLVPAEGCCSSISRIQAHFQTRDLQQFKRFGCVYDHEEEADCIIDIDQWQNTIPPKIIQSQEIREAEELLQIIKKAEQMDEYEEENNDNIVIENEDVTTEDPDFTTDSGYTEEDTSPATTPTPATTIPPPSGGLNAGQIAGIVIGSIVGVVLIIVLIYFIVVKCDEISDGDAYDGIPTAPDEATFTKSSFKTNTMPVTRSYKNTAFDDRDVERYV